MGHALIRVHKYVCRVEPKFCRSKICFEDIDFNLIIMKQRTQKEALTSPVTYLKEFSWKNLLRGREQHLSITI